MKRTFWHNDATSVENTLDRVMYEIKFDDIEGLLLDSVSLADIIEDSDGLMAFDALITPYARLPARMDVIKRVMIRAGTTVQPLNVQTSEPFMQNGTANVAAIFELSDGQTITIFFHNPDTTPKKILPTDELISWKWLLNKKDITIVVAPEKGLDLNPRQVAVRIMKLAEKNSASFIRSNSKRAERMQELEDLKTEITGLEGDLKGALHRLEIAKVEKEDRDMAVIEPEVIEPVVDLELTATEEETNEQTNEQTEVETETEAAGSEGDSVDTIELTGNELGEFPDTEDGKKALRKAAEDYLQSIKNKWVPCSAIGVDVDVEIRKKGIDKVISASADIRKLKLISGIEKLITNGKKVGERPPYDSDTDKSAIRYITLRTKVLLDGKSLAIRTVIKEDNNGIFHYDFSVFEQEAVFDSIRQEKAPINEAFTTTTSNDGGTYPSRLASCQLKNNISQIDECVNVVLDSTNSSKMVLNLFIEGEDSEVAESDESEANEVKQADPAATANINASSVSDAIKKKAIKYLQENPESHEIKGLSAKSLNVIIENIRSALFAEVKALSPLFIEVSDTNLSLKTPSGYLNLAIYKQKGFVTGYKVDFYGGNENYTNNLFDSTSTIAELSEWGFSLPFDLDVKAFVANVIKPEVDKLLSQKEIKNEPETENESVPIPSDSDVVIAPESEGSSEVDSQSEEQAEEDEPMEDFEPEVIEPSPTITGNTEIDGYKSKLLGLQQLQDRMKAANKIIKSKQSDEQKTEALKALGYSDHEAYVLLKPDFAGRMGYTYQLTNNNANIASTKKRITQLEAQDLAASKANSGDSQTSYDFDGGTIELDYSADRLKVDFDAIPDSDMNSKLKRNGFKWSPTNRVWQRQLTDNAISTANYLFGTNIKTAATMMTEEENKPRPNPIVPAVEPVITQDEELTMAQMTAQAALWKGATMQVAELLHGNDKKSMQLMRETTKGDLDAYLMRKFGIDETTARDVSNTLTAQDIPADMSANLDDYKDELWYSLINPIPEIIEPVQNETAEIDAEITEPSNNSQTEKISAYSDELDSIKQETNSIELMRRLNDIVARIEADNLMDEMDVKLNQASDAVDELFREAQKNAA